MLRRIIPYLQNLQIFRSTWGPQSGDASIIPPSSPSNTPEINTIEFACAIPSSNPSTLVTSSTIEESPRQSSINIKRKLSDDSSSTQLPQKKIKLNVSAKNQLSAINNKFNIVEMYAVPEIFVENREVKKYFIHNEEDIQQLEKDKRLKFNNNYSYHRTSNEKTTTLQLFLASVWVLGDELGVYTAKEINCKRYSRKNIGKYAGKIINPGDENKKNKYLFEITDEDHNVLHYIDGTNGNWTSLLNFSTISNVYVIQQHKQIRFRIGMDMDANDQLLFNYGTSYYKQLGFKPFFLHPSDKWESPSEIYKRNETLYKKQLVCFDEITCKDWGLKANSSWLIPEIFIDIIKDNPEALNAKLSQGCPADLLAYACNENGILGPADQQHITALMLACYLGNEACINLLLKRDADANRQMLVSGHSPFSLLLLGHGKNEVVDKIGLFLLKIMPHIFLYDNKYLTLLHYAIVRNSACLTSELLKIADKDDNFYEFMFDQEKASSHADLDYCLLNGQFEILQLLLKNMMEKNILIKNIDNGNIFSANTLNSASIANLTTLKEILLTAEFDDIAVKTKSNLLSKIETVLTLKLSNQNISTQNNSLFSSSKPRTKSKKDKPTAPVPLKSSYSFRRKES